MKYVQLLLFFIVASVCGFAQPVNDECAGAIDLGTAPVCVPGDVYTTVGATRTQVGGQQPSCFENGGTQRDVWFQVTTSPTVERYRIRVQGVANGQNGAALRNPQVALYRGDCDGLSELLCASADNGDREVVLNMEGLPLGFTYFIRVNDFTASATPNAGDFTICVDEVLPDVRMGELDRTTACSGTLFDSGGPNENYQNGEDLTFTICPDQEYSCLLLEFRSYGIAQGDLLTIYEGEEPGPDVLVRVQGVGGARNVFPIQAGNDCVTLQFTSGGFTTGEGFEMEWQCESALCLPTSEERVTAIGRLPFSGEFGTCGVPASLARTACGLDVFLNGPEKIFTYQSAGNECLSVLLSSVTTGLGFVVLDGPPSHPATQCVVSSDEGFERLVTLEEQGLYYIVVGHPSQCVSSFNILLEPFECPILPTLETALGNPLNGCAGADGLPSMFIFEDGTQDMEITVDVNSGCWNDIGQEPDFVWFTIEAQADGAFGFILSSSQSSDIDVNVWGPYEDVLENEAAITELIRTTQPIRSSWSLLEGVTGLADIHPTEGTPVRDEFDCGSPDTPNAQGDSFVRTIDAKKGQVYVVLINDHGNDIEDSTISIDWAPSDLDILAPIPSEIITRDTAVCQGESVQLELDTQIDRVLWSPANMLSCSNCLDPVATPQQTTTYTAIVEGVCVTDTLEITVFVYSVDAGPDQIICINDNIQIIGGSDFEDATYTWSAPSAVEFSCTDCPNPIIRPTRAGTFQVSVNLEAAGCSDEDVMILRVTNEEAPQFEIPEREVSICAGETIELGSNDNDGRLSYTWTSIPEGFTSNNRNPSVQPTVSTTYYVAVENESCSIPSIDSVVVSVAQPLSITIANDTMICEADTVFLGLSMPQNGAEYSWVGQDIDDPTALNTFATPRQSGSYTLTANRGACRTTASLSVDVTPINLPLLGMDTMRICRGEELILGLDSMEFRPMDSIPFWSATDETLLDTTGLQVRALPQDSVTYYVEVNNAECYRIDSVFVVVDSLPMDLSIAPVDTMICAENFVELNSPIYEPAHYPAIEFMWTPPDGQQTPDSLYHLVVTPREDTTYIRTTTHGVCVSIDTARIIVNPLPDIEIIPSDTTICPGETVPLEVNLLNPEEVTIESYEWMPETGLSCTDCATPIASATGQYSVEVMSDKMCPGSATVTILNKRPPSLNIPTTLTICQGETISLNPDVNSNTVYTWTSSDPTFMQTNTPNPQVNPTTTTTYTVTAQDVEGGCDPIMAEVRVIVLPPNPIIEVDESTTICKNDSTISITAMTMGRSGTFKWSLGSDTLQEDSGLRSVFTPTLDTTRTFVVTYKDRCGSASDSITITVIQDTMVLGIKIIEPNRDTYYWGDEVTLEVETSPSRGNVMWSNTHNEDTSTSDSILIATLPGSGSTATYIASIENGRVCPPSAAEITIPIESPYGIPNVFTPNGDGLNDTFGLVSALLQGSETPIAQALQMRVYDRWGAVVYDFTRPDNPDAMNRIAAWDGTKDGAGETALPSDVYVYTMTITINEQFTIEAYGEITLVR